MISTMISTLNKNKNINKNKSKNKNININKNYSCQRQHICAYARTVHSTASYERRRA